MAATVSNKTKQNKIKSWAKISREVRGIEHHVYGKAALAEGGGPWRHGTSHIPLLMKVFLRPHVQEAQILFANWILGDLRDYQ